MREHNSVRNYPELKASDRAVLRHLRERARAGNGETCMISIPRILERARAGNGETCMISIPRIANACDISERQVQISTRRLIDARLIERLGYDFSNPDRSKRGTLYRVHRVHAEARSSKGREARKKSVKLIL